MLVDYALYYVYLFVTPQDLSYARRGDSNLMSSPGHRNAHLFYPPFVHEVENVPHHLIPILN